MKFNKIMLSLFLSISSFFQLACEYRELQAYYTVHQAPFSPATIQAIEKIIGYTFKDKLRLKKDFTTESKDSNANYKFYETRGDAILREEQKKMLQNQFPKATKGELSRARTAIESIAPLGALGVKLGLHEYIQDVTQKIGANVIEDVIEAIIGAIHEDGGPEAAARFIERFFYPMIKDCTVPPCLPDDAVSLIFPGQGHCYRAVSSAGCLVCELTLTDTKKIDRVGYAEKWKKVDPSSRVAEYNAATRFIRERLPKQYHKYLISWPLDDGFGTTSAEIKQTLRKNRKPQQYKIKSKSAAKQVASSSYTESSAIGMQPASQSEESIVAAGEQRLSACEVAAVNQVLVNNTPASSQDNHTQSVGFALFSLAIELFFNLATAYAK